MYQLGHRRPHHYIFYGGLIVAAVLLVFGAVALARLILQPHTVLKQANPVIHTVTASDAQLQEVRKSIFSLQLPSSWQTTTPPDIPYTVYSWAGTGKSDSARRLDVYVDKLPGSLAVNRLLPVQSAGNQLDVIGETSDNCVNFTDRTSASAATGQAPSKWGGVNFLCDTGNYERDVVAIGSAEALNQVTLTGPTAGMHHVLLVYRDNSGGPDYSIFVAIVKSFHLI